MKITNNIFKLFLLVATLSFSSCETFDLDQTDNPSTLPAELLDPVYVFNYAQLTLPDFVNSANYFTQRVTRQMAMTNGTSYDNSFAPVDFDNNWTTGYLMLNAIKLMEPKAIQNEQYFILGASKVIRCYVLLTMVDMYGNIPYSEALQGNGNLTPNYDNSKDVYKGIYNELNEAIDYLKLTDPSDGALRARDLYYGSGNEGSPGSGKWVTLANTLKFKMLVTARNAGNWGDFANINDEVNTLFNGDIMNSTDDDFAFQYSTERDLPNSRHPMYNDQYEFGAGAYIANYFFWAVANEKVATPDPREKYYFFKQVTLTADNANSQTAPCTSLPKPPAYGNSEYASFYNSSILAPYCYSAPLIGNSYLGRDHGDASGIPSDDKLRSVVGAYPAGGAIGTPTQVNGPTSAGLKGALGKGIMPMMLYSYVRFLRAEAVLTMGVAGDAKSELEEGIKESVKKTTTLIPEYAPIVGNSTNYGQPTQTVINDQTEEYLTYVLENYDLSNAADRLQIIIKEYYIAAWGNGIEPYNNYRRTGYPANFQPTIEENPGPYFYTALYAGASVNNNPNAPSNVRTKKVFWDTLSLDLH